MNIDSYRMVYELHILFALEMLFQFMILYVNFAVNVAVSDAPAKIEL